MSAVLDKGLSTDEAIGAFEQEIARQEDIVYGVALFFECSSILHADQKGHLETLRKQYRNIIQRGRQTIQQASKALQEVRQDPKKLHLLEHFMFSPCAGHGNPAEMEKRALILSATYKRIFPERPRDKAFSQEETFQLIEEANSTLKD